MSTRGWTVVSPHNPHIDVSGVFIAPGVHRVGALTGDGTLRGAAAQFARLGVPVWN